MISALCQLTFNTNQHRKSNGQSETQFALKGPEIVRLWLITPVKRQRKSRENFGGKCTSWATQILQHRKHLVSDGTLQLTRTTAKSLGILCVLLSAPSNLAPFRQPCTIPLEEGPVHRPYHTWSPRCANWLSTQTSTDKNAQKHQCYN